jgi:hypothetical protein
MGPHPQGLVFRFFDVISAFPAMFLTKKTC